MTRKAMPYEVHTEHHRHLPRMTLPRHAKWRACVGRKAACSCLTKKTKTILWPRACSARSPRPSIPREISPTFSGTLGGGSEGSCWCRRLVTSLLKFDTCSVSLGEDTNNSSCSRHNGSSPSPHSYRAAGFHETLRPLDLASCWAVAIGVPA
jgi:hypothetical protein